MNSCDLSVIVPIYNVECYLRECLNSIYLLEGITYEVILVNDGSTDSSKDIIEEYRCKYTCITTVITQKNSGLSAARNVGLRKAKGRYLSFVDSDDFVIPNSIVELLSLAMTHELDIIYGDFEYCSEISTPLKTPLRFNKRLSPYVISDGNDFWSKALYNDAISVEAWGQLYRREFLVKNNLLFKEKLFHEDFLFSFQCSYFANRVMYVPLIFYRYRQRIGSIMHDLTLEKQIHKLHIVEELHAFSTSNDINSISWNTMLFATYFDVVRRSRIKNTNIYRFLNKTNLSFLSKIKALIIPFLNIGAKEVEISLYEKKN